MAGSVEAKVASEAEKHFVKGFVKGALCVCVCVRALPAGQQAV